MYKRGNALDITYKNKKIERVCTDAKTAERTYGREMADKIHQRIDEICAVDTVEDNDTVSYQAMSYTEAE